MRPSSRMSRIAAAVNDFVIEAIRQTLSASGRVSAPSRIVQQDQLNE